MSVYNIILIVVVIVFPKGIISRSKSCKWPNFIDSEIRNLVLIFKIGPSYYLFISESKSYKHPIVKAKIMCGLFLAG